MTLEQNERPVIGRVTADEQPEIEERLTSTEIVDAPFDPYLGWPDPDVGLTPINPVPPQHPSAPSSGFCYVPPNGLALSVLTKQTDADFDAVWLPAGAASLPPGGVATDVLTKMSATDGDATWQQAPQEVFVGLTDPAAAYPQIDLWYDTTTTPGVLKVRVGGAWVTVQAGGEVWIGPTDPIAANPTTEVWWDTINKDLKVRVGAAWLSTSEVYVGGTDPYVTDPNASAKLWWDTTLPVRSLKIRNGAAWEVAMGSEVEIGNVDPQPANLGAELWYDTTVAGAHVLKAWVAGAWEPVDEVAVSATDPRVADPLATTQLWYDTNTSPGVLKVWVAGQWLPIILAGGVIPQLAYGMAPTPGVSAAVSRGDHVHGTPPLPPATPTDYGTVIAAKTYDLPPSSGQSPSLSRSDHEHGTPRSEVAIGDTEPSTPKDLWVNTSVDPHILNAYVGGVYVEVGAAGETPPNEVQIGGADPSVRFAEVELWYDTSAVPPILKARVNDAWVDVTAASVSEVEIASSDPYTTDPNSVAELWFDTAANVRALKVRENGAWVLASPAFGTVYPQLSFGMPTNPGVSEEASRADHSHGTPTLADSAGEVEIQPDDPTTANPKVELWVDSDETWDAPAGTDEVWVGPDDPRAAGGVQELWFNTTVTPPLLMAWDGTQWVLSSTAPSEMEIGATDPYTTNPASVSELWFDTTGLSAVPPTVGVLRARVNNAWVPATGAGLIWRGMWNSATVYAQGDAVSYDQPSGPVIGTPVNPGVSAYECLAQTTIGAAPPPQDRNRWRLIVEAGEPGAKGEQGIPGLAWKGVWSAAGLYAVNDAVSYTATIGLAPGVSSYRCIEAVVSAGLTPPTDTTHWTLVAEAGQQGPEGEMGAATIIVGDFGQSKAPADLPPTGLIPANWDAPGNPLLEYQMTFGQSLFYAPIAGAADPADGHMFQFVTTNSDPSGWLDIGAIKGQPGDPGITWQGQWSDTQQYAVNDGVYYGGSSYRCVIAVLGGAPPDRNRNNWTLLAAGATYNGTTDLWVGPGAPPANPPPMPPTELWYDTDAVPVIPTHALRAFWQPDVQYVPGDQVLWPETASDIRMANRETIGEEPGVTGINDALDFPDRGASPTVAVGLSAVLNAPDYADGVDIRYHTGKYAWGTQWVGGALFAATNAGNLPVFMALTVADATTPADLTLATLRFSVLTNLAVPVDMDVPFTAIDTLNRPFLRFTAEVATNTLRMYDSANGVDWTELGTALVSPDPLLTNGVTAFHIGHDNDEPMHNWGGPQAEVETFNFAGVMQSSWVAFTQPSNPDGPNYPDPAPDPVPTPGTGISPQSGEDYQMVGASNPVWLVDRYPAWVNVTSAVQWLAAGEETTARAGEGITWFGGKRLYESGGGFVFRGPTGSPGTNLVTSGYIVIDAEAAGNVNAHFYHDFLANVNGTQETVFESRSGDSKQNWWAQGVKVSYNSRNESKQVTACSVGGYGNQWAYQTTIASPPGLDSNGAVTALSLGVRSSAATKENVADVDRDVAGKLIDALRPITFERIIDTTPPPNSPEDDGPPPKRPPVFRQVGFTAEDIEASGTPLLDHIVKPINRNSIDDSPADVPDNKMISVDGLLAVAIAEIKSLRERVAQLEAQPK